MLHQCRWWILIGFACWGGACSTSQAAMLTLDNFSTTQSLLVTNSQTTAQSAVSGAGIIGGEREIHAGLLAQLGSSIELGSNRYGTPGFDFSANARAAGLSVVIWDGADNDLNNINPAGLGGLDFSGNAGTVFSLTNVSSDHGFGLTVRLYDATDASGQTWCEALLNVASSVAGQDLNVTAAEFTGNGPGGPFNWSKVGAITMTIDGMSRPALDLTIGSALVVPEPGSLALAGLAVAGLAVVGRMIRKNA